jgi:hypothetical protein
MLFGPAADKGRSSSTSWKQIWKSKKDVTELHISNCEAKSLSWSGYNGHQLICAISWEVKRDGYSVSDYRRYSLWSAGSCAAHVAEQVVG